MRRLLFALSLVVSAAPVGAGHPFAARLDAEIPKRQAEHATPGIAVALIEGGEIVDRRLYGTATAGEDVALGGDTGFNIGSVSKTFTAWGVMKLAERGHFEFDEPAFRHITRWTLPRSVYDVEEVTIARLLSHTSGVDGDGANDWEPGARLPSIERELTGVAGAQPIRLRLRPGRRWAYADGNYALLQLLVMQSTSRSFERHMAEMVLAPLGLERTSFELSKPILAGLATPHHPGDEPTHVARRQVVSTSGCHSTLDDLARFAIALYDAGPGQRPGRGVLKPETIARMLEPQPATGGTWGLGYQIRAIGPDDRIVGHGGGARGWSASMWIDPDRGNGYVMLTNSTGSVPIDEWVDREWRLWYLSSLVSEVPVIRVRDEQRRLLGDWKVQLIVPDERFSGAIKLWISSERVLMGKYVNADGEESRLDVLELTADGFRATVPSLLGSLLVIEKTGPRRGAGTLYLDGAFPVKLSR